MAVTSGGSRARSGPAPDPSSYRSQKNDRQWVTLPASGYDGEAPAFPLSRPRVTEKRLWAELWRRPQAAEWARLNLVFQVAAYARAFIDSTASNAPASIKTAVLRMETELGISPSGMKQNGWIIGEAVKCEEGAPRAAARQTSSGDWLKAVKVDEGA